jgi:membrane-bound lytic murein transglycosylase D
MSEAELRSVNGIPSGMRIKAGSTLLVSRTAHAAADVSEQVADNASIALSPDGPALRRISFKAGRRGDSVAAVAKRYRVSAAQVADWNSVAAGARFAPGQQIVVMVARPAPKASGVATGSKAKTASRATPARTAGGSSIKATSQSTSKTRRRSADR